MSGSAVQIAFVAHDVHGMSPFVKNSRVSLCRTHNNRTPYAVEVVRQAEEGYLGAILMFN
jgi:hypothetical protein